MAMLAASMVALALTPAAALASDGPANYEYPSNRLSPQYKFTKLNDPAGACFYRIRYGNYGNVAYAQIRFYGGACAGTRVTLFAHDGTAEHYYTSRSSTGGTDGCGSYIEFQATSAPGHVATSMTVHTPAQYIISYDPDPRHPFDTPVKFC